MTAESIQLLHTGCGHWVAISTIGYKLAEVNVYHSMRPVLTDSLKRQISAILCLPIQKKECILKYEQMHCYLLLILLMLSIVIVIANWIISQLWTVYFCIYLNFS